MLCHLICMHRTYGRECCTPWQHLIMVLYPESWLKKNCTHNFDTNHKLSLFGVVIVTVSIRIMSQLCISFRNITWMDMYKPNSFWLRLYLVYATAYSKIYTATLFQNQTYGQFLTMFWLKSFLHLPTEISKINVWLKSAAYRYLTKLDKCAGICF